MRLATLKEQACARSDQVDTETVVAEGLAHHCAAHLLDRLAAWKQLPGRTEAFTNRVKTVASSSRSRNGARSLAGSHPGFCWRNAAALARCDDRRPRFQKQPAPGHRVWASEECARLSYRTRLALQCAGPCPNKKLREATGRATPL